MSNQEQTKLLILPNFIKTKNQIVNALREILQIEEFFNNAQNRQPGTKISLPKTTGELDKFAEVNGRSILNHHHRLELAKFLRDIYKFAPVVSVVLPSYSNKSVTDAIVEWFRSSVHAQTLFQLSSQSKLSGGAIIRIKHKTYDFSLNSRFNQTNKIWQETMTTTLAKSKITNRSKFF